MRNYNPTAKPHISIWRHNYSYIPANHIYKCSRSDKWMIGSGPTPMDAYLHWTRLLLVLKG